MLSLPAPFHATGDALCYARVVEPPRWFGAFQEKTLVCNAAARNAIDRVCQQGGFTQSWAREEQDGFVAMTKLPLVVLVHLMLGLPAGSDKEVRSLLGAYSICMDPHARTCMNVIAGRRPHPRFGFVLDKFSLYYPDNAAIPAAWGSTWSLLHGYSFRTAVLDGSLNRAALSDVRRGTMRAAEGASFDRHKHLLVIDDDSEYEDCAYVQAVAGESDAARLQRIESMVSAMSAAYAGEGTLAMSYDPVERARGVTALESEWALLKAHLPAGTRARPTLRQAGDKVLDMVREAAKQEGKRQKPLLVLAAEAFLSAGHRAKTRPRPRRTLIFDGRRLRRLPAALVTLSSLALGGAAYVAAPPSTTPLWWLLLATVAFTLATVDMVVQDGPSSTPPRHSTNQNMSQQLMDAANPEGVTPSRKGQGGVSFSRRRSSSLVAQPLPEAARAFVGTWDVETIEDQPGDYDAYLQKLGVGWMMRSVAAKMRPSPTFSIEEGVLHSRAAGPAGSELHDVFTTGSVLNVSIGGKAVEMVYQWEGDVLQGIGRSAELAGGDAIQLRRWIPEEEPDTLRLESSFGGAATTRTYRRQVSPA